MGAIVDNMYFFFISYASSFSYLSVKWKWEESMLQTVKPAYLIATEPTNEECCDSLLI